MIIEGLVTTENEDGTPHLAPMGPRIEAAWSRLVLRPYVTSTTYANLRRGRCGVFHVTDDVLLLAQAAIGGLAALPPLRRPLQAQGWVLADACRWYAFEVRAIDDTPPRVSMTAEVVEQGWQRDFVGFHRARHAVVEAAILATRVRILPPEEVLAEMARLRPLVVKTGGEAEQQAFRLLEEYVGAAYGAVRMRSEKGGEGPQDGLA